MRFRNSVALVTGGTIGIGYEIARRLHEEGASVLLVARDAARGSEAAARIGDDRVAFHVGDIADPEACTSAVAAAEERFGPLDVLVNNAGIDLDEPLLDVAPETVRRTFETNAVGTLFMLQAAARAMRAGGRGGAIVNLSSRLARVGVPGMTVYGATKGAVESLTRGAAIELAPDRIRVNAVAPGMTRTPMFDAWIAEHPEGARAADDVARAIPLGRIGEPADVVAAVAFLAAPEAGFITGATLAVDGGYTAA